MTYWQILQNRRTSLRLSLEEVSAQTQIPVPYLEAIEANHLYTFSNNLYLVETYTQSYCYAIGVYWNAIAEDVQANVNGYAKRKNLSVQPPVRRAPQKKSSSSNKKSSSSKGKSGKKSTKKSNSKTGTSGTSTKKKSAAARRKEAMRKRRQARLTLAAFFLFVFVIAGMFIYSSYSDQKAEAIAAQEEKDRQAELAAKEEETTRLAEQKQQGVTSSVSTGTLTFTPSQEDANVYTVENLLSNTSSIALSIKLPENSTVIIYKDDTLMTPQPETVYESEYTTTLSVDSACTIVLEIGTYSGGTITFNGQEISYDTSNFTEGNPATLTFNIVDDRSQESGTEDSSEDGTEAQSDEGYSEDEYSEDSDDEEVYFDGNYN
jgi:cytoskeletal protein RodZ